MLETIGLILYLGGIAIALGVLFLNCSSRTYKIKVRSIYLAVVISIIGGIIIICSNTNTKPKTMYLTPSGHYIDPDTIQVVKIYGQED